MGCGVVEWLVVWQCQQKSSSGFTKPAVMRAFIAQGIWLSRHLLSPGFKSQAHHLYCCHDLFDRYYLFVIVCENDPANRKQIEIWPNLDIFWKMSSEFLHKLSIQLFRSFKAVVVVKWSACSPSTPTIRVQIPLKISVLSVKFIFEKTKNTQKEVQVGH